MSQTIVLADGEERAIETDLSGYKFSVGDVVSCKYYGCALDGEEGEIVGVREGCSGPQCYAIYVIYVNGCYHEHEEGGLELVQKKNRTRGLEVR